MRVDGAMVKQAAVLNAAAREKIPDGGFALPGRRYPIHDVVHARAALSMAAKHGTTVERARVRAAVHRRYPEIGAGGKKKHAEYIRVPSAPAKVELQPVRKKRKKFPFQGYIDFQGLKIHVENKAGSYRRGVDKDGKPWKVLCHYHYGEIEGTKGVDSDPVDVYVGPDANSPLVVVVRQQEPTTRKYDEDKIMVGFSSEEEAIRAYKRQYNRPGFYMDHRSMPIGRFLAWCVDKTNYKTKVAGLSVALVASTLGERSSVPSVFWRYAT